MGIVKLKKKEKCVRIVGKESQRRKKDKQAEQKLQKLPLSDVGNAEEVVLFFKDGSILVFRFPKVRISMASNLVVVKGQLQVKMFHEILPNLSYYLTPEQLMEISGFTNKFVHKSDVVAAKDTRKEDDMMSLVKSFEALSLKDRKCSDTALGSIIVKASTSESEKFESSEDYFKLVIVNDTDDDGDQGGSQDEVNQDLMMPKFPNVAEILVKQMMPNEDAEDEDENPQMKFENLIADSPSEGESPASEDPKSDLDISIEDGFETECESALDSSGSNDFSDNGSCKTMRSML